MVLDDAAINIIGEGEEQPKDTIRKQLVANGKAAIDAVDAIDYKTQPLGTNLFYLPRYIPDGIYFIITRRPFKKEQSRLLIEAPSKYIDLSEYSLKNWDKEGAFVKHWQKMQGEGLSDVNLQVLKVLVSVGKDMTCSVFTALSTS
mgnify:CR=1 FL=1